MNESSNRSIDKMSKTYKHVKNIIIKCDDSMFNGLNELNDYLSMNKVNSH